MGSVEVARAADPSPPAHPDLGVTRYRDPVRPRELWLGAELGGIYLPEALGLFNRDVWTLRTTGAWSFRVARWLVAGGRHGVAWYDATGPASSIRLRFHEHQLELSTGPLGQRVFGLRDRLFAGITTHDAKTSTVGGNKLKVGGIEDFLLHLGYGLEHAMAARWTLGWQVQLRYAWVFRDTQRQVRGSLRFAFLPKPAHRLTFEAILYYVHRDDEQFGNPLPRHGAYAQGLVDYSWMSRHGVGVGVQLRGTSSFLSGEAPVYEVREEALNNPYGDVTVGLRAALP